MERIPGYRTIRRLGSGGMAEVFLVEREADGTRAAMKRLLPAYRDSDVMRRRFSHESRTTGSLNHPNIIKVIDYFETDDDCALVVEYIEGPSLDDLIEQSRVFPPIPAAMIAREILKALECAHAAGIVHRDLKPSNVLFRLDGTPVVTDFGIAYAPELTRLTQSGHLMGTPAYMSPEQASGEKVDPRADIYSTGAIVYEMLAGQPAFAGDSTAAVFMNILGGSRRDLFELNPTVDEQMEGIVDRCLAKDPEARFQDAATALRAVTGYLEGRLQPGDAGSLKRLVEDPPGAFTELHSRSSAAFVADAEKVLGRSRSGLELAHMQLSRALFLTPDDPAIQTRLRELSARLNISASPDLQKKIEVLEGKLSAHPDDPGATLQLARLYRQTGRLLQVEARLRQLRRTRPGDTYLLRQVASLVGETPLSPAAPHPPVPIVILDAPDRRRIPWRWIAGGIVIALVAGVTYYIGHFIDTRQSTLEGAILSEPLFDPNDEPAKIDPAQRRKTLLVTQAQRQANGGNPFEAIAMYDRLLREFPTDPEAASFKLAKGLLLSQMMRWFEAEPLLREVVKAGGKAGLDARVELASIAEKKAEYGEAAREWREIERLTRSDDPLHQRAAARAAEDESKTGEAPS